MHAFSALASSGSEWIWGESSRSSCVFSRIGGAPGESLPAATGQRRAGPAVRRRGSFAPFTDIKKSLYLRCRRWRPLLQPPPTGVPARAPALSPNHARIIMNAALKAARTAAKSAAKPAADYVVKDVNLADWGRKEIAIAETEMPGLM